MATPRHCIVNEDEVGTYHCISRCVRRSKLMGDGLQHRRDWIESRIAELQESMAIDVTAWCILSNHMHLMVTIRPDVVRSWSDQDVAMRYLRMCPGRWRRKKKGVALNAPPTTEEIAEITGDPKRLATVRKRLSSLSWFMGRLKEYVARRANLEDDCEGHFWEKRFRSIKVLDPPARLITATYVDLNAVRAGMVSRPEDTPHGSIGERARELLGIPRRTRIRMESAPHESEASYLAHVDAWGRCARPGAGAIIAELPPILERLETDRSRWAELFRTGWDSVRGTVIGTLASRKLEAARRGSDWVIGVLPN
ncbi:MAG: hypothetical protein RLZZ461_1089 [Planctomycetota bacterium]|jgi:REP element-mobilizing transposase RayT